jgi:hypothetical protein
MVELGLHSPKDGAMDLTLRPQISSKRSTSPLTTPFDAVARLATITTLEIGPHLELVS